MNKTFYKLVFGFIVIVSSHACKKCDCIDENLSPNFVSFDSSEIDTIVIRKYFKDNSFNDLIDTASFFVNQSYGIKKNGDTLSFPYRSGDFSVSADFDWIIFLPSTNTSMKISNIVSPKTSMACGSSKVQCLNPVESMEINGVTQRPIFYNFYIVK